MQNFSIKGWADYSQANIEFKSGNSLKYLEDKTVKYDALLCMGLLSYYEDIEQFGKQ